MDVSGNGTERGTPSSPACHQGWTVRGPDFILNSRFVSDIGPDNGACAQPETRAMGVSCCSRRPGSRLASVRLRESRIPTEPPACEVREPHSKYKLGLFRLRTESGGLLRAARNSTSLLPNLNALQIQKEDTDILRSANNLRYAFNILSFSGQFPASANHFCPKRWP